MNLHEAFNLFDAYSRRARVVPGFIAAAPVVVIALFFLPGRSFASLGPIAVGMGFLFLLANMVRHAGRNVERRLVSAWDGLPTTRMLRYRTGNNPVLFERRRKALERLYGTTLPTRRQEAASPEKADELYVAATRCLITHVRAHHDAFPLVQTENINYGFARNMLGLKPCALLILAVAAGVDYLFWRHDGVSSQFWIVVGVHCLLASTWLSFVRRPWVKQTATTYADRLFEALDHPAKLTTSAGEVAPT